MATPDPKTPTRKQLFKLLGNHEMVRLFERLFDRSGEINPDDIDALYLLIDEITIDSGIADAKATQASDMVIRLKEAAQMAILEIGTSSSKAQQASDMVVRLKEETQSAIMSIETAMSKSNQAIGAAHDVNKKIGSAIRYTGIVEHEGGLVTLNADITKIDITSCSYWLSGIEYTYAGGTAITPTIGTGDSSFFVGLDSDGLIYSGTTWTDSQKETIVPLCRLQAVQGQSGPGSDLQPPIDQRYLIGEEGWVRRLWHEQTIGVLYFQGGEIYESTTPLQISENAGTFYTAQGVSKDIAADTDLEVSDNTSGRIMPPFEPIDQTFLCSSAQA